MEENENVVDETTQEQTVETVDESKFESAGDDSVIKVDLSKSIEEDATREQSTDEVPVRDESETSEEVLEENVEEQVEEPAREEEQAVQDDEPTVQEITDEEVEQVTEEVEEAIAEAQETGKPLPENIQKLVDFMEDTGGDIQDYVRLNQDYSDFDSLSLLREYYKQTKPHLDLEEIDFHDGRSIFLRRRRGRAKRYKKKKISFERASCSSKEPLGKCKIQIL